MHFLTVFHTMTSTSSCSKSTHFLNNVIIFCGGNNLHSDVMEHIKNKLIEQKFNYSLLSIVKSLIEVSPYQHAYRAKTPTSPAAAISKETFCKYTGERVLRTHASHN